MPVSSRPTSTCRDIRRARDKVMVAHQQRRPGETLEHAARRLGLVTDLAVNEGGRSSRGGSGDRWFSGKGEAEFAGC